MRFLSAMVVSGLMLLGGAPGFADTLTSASHRFSVNFPGAAKQGETKDNEKDGAGNVISKATEFVDSVPDRYFVLLAADIYITPYKMTANGYIAPNIRNFLDGIKATATQRDTTVDGYPAVEFDFGTADQRLKGKGVVVYVGEAIPRGYMLVAVPLANATEDDKARLNTFLSSFEID
jgi:hypothetical protein